MKTIFENLGEWDWFGEEKEGNDLGYNHAGMFVGVRFFTLADLLANPSWCKAVWGEEKMGMRDYMPIAFDYKTTDGVSLDNLPIKYDFCSCLAYKILRDKGKDECIKFIEKTMV